MSEIHETRVEPNLLRASEIWANAAEGGWAMHAEGLHAFGCEAGHRAFNHLLITESGIVAPALKAMTSAFEHGRFRLRFRDELLESVLPTAEGAGLERQGGIPTMTMVLPGAAEAPKSDLRIERVTDEGSLTDHVRVVADGFSGWMPETLGRIFTTKLLNEPSWAGWVGYEDGEAVASSQLVVHDGVAGLYYIATVEAARRKGYGGAITRAAIAEGVARGCDLVCLQASPLGRPVYERIGFAVIGEYITYVPSEHA